MYVCVCVCVYVYTQIQTHTDLLKWGPMLFHACWVIYTVKELDSRAKHGQSFKNDLDL